MKKISMKRLLSFLLLLTFITSAVATGCSSKPANSANSAEPTDKEDKKEDTIVIKLGHHHNVDGVVDLYCKKFAELADTKSNGRIRVDVYPGAQLGQENEAAEGILMGTQQMSGVSTTAYNNLIKGFGLDMLPFMFDSYESIMKVFTDSPVGEELESRFLKQNGRILGWIALGGRHMIFTDKDIKSVSQMKGMKMRSPESDLFVGMFNALGCRPTPITWGETYTALQTNVVDGMESPTTSMKDMKFYEVAKYCLLTNHMWGTFNLVINEGFFQSLPQDIQQIIIDSGKEASVYANKVSQEEEKKSIDFLKEKGMVFHELPEEDAVIMRASIEPVIDKWGKEHGAVELIKMLREEVKK
ncbi:TRAP transporter substrate-binding protein [Lutispora saccharofermentans]|uniref:TRAP transporter substrate-binding protein n=1 Tax=Lutispora saccharofermentans TaxID=3024236 RepID=A0ABT1NHE4_9FIRM|nr:TRAP transporter substrate-binding protein [Lutispora saccharofermentans]MCQ1530672.1 TRAP transporter substrate-binding protein [Lutispora saccharofermentans]